MKRWIFLALFLCQLLRITAFAEDFHIVVSFYPMYILTENIVSGVEGVTLESLSEQNTGCLHDYQLTTHDMVILDGADALVINGGGMEHFMDKVLSLRAELPIINACGTMELIQEESGEMNAHVWLDPRLAAQQVRNIAEGLAGADPSHAAEYESNGEAYAQRLLALDAQLEERLAPVAGNEIITFHEAFTYFAERYGLVIAGVIETEPGEEPSTRQIAEICDLVLEKGVKALFVEPQYPQRAAQTISAETGAGIWKLDPIVTGTGSPDSYEQTMLENAETLLEALGK